MIQFHDLLHKHRQIAKDGLGVLAFCESRLPAPLGRVSVMFQPDFDGARWWGVPEYHCGDGELLLTKIIHAGSAFHAMSLLRGAYDEMAEGKYAGPEQEQEAA